MGGGGYEGADNDRADFSGNGFSSSGCGWEEVFFALFVIEGRGGRRTVRGWGEVNFVNWQIICTFAVGKICNLPLKCLTLSHRGF